MTTRFQRLVALAGTIAAALAGQILGWHWLKRRIQEQQMEELRTRQQAELQRLLRRLDHELKNPITAIRFALANLAAIAQDDAQRRSIETIEAQTMRISRLITDLRKLADFDRVSLEHIPIDVEVLVQETLSLVTEQAGMEGRQVAYADSGTLVCTTIYGDRYLLLLAFYNLIDNALKFTKPENHIQVRVTERTDGVWIEVEDDGPGISPDELDHVWGELYRGSSMHHIPGSGLGLALAKTIIERHGGRIWIESEVDAGTTVTCWLPCDMSTPNVL